MDKGFMVRPLIRSITFITLYSIVRYRRSMVDDNLRKAFSMVTESEIVSIRRKYYKVLSRYICEAILDPFLSVEAQKQKVKFTNLDILKEPNNDQQQIVVLSSHLGNWELITPQMPNHFNGHIVGVYKPLSSKWMDQYIKNKRGRFGLKLKAMQQVFKSMINREADIYIFINDQSPARGAKGKWIDFLGIPTLWFDGIDKLKKRVDLDFYYQRVVPNEDCYRVEYIKIDNSDPLEAYVQLLNEDVTKYPEYWLWSHNRWKN